MTASRGRSRVASRDSAGGTARRYRTTSDQTAAVSDRLRVIRYARVSTDEQANGWGLPAQREVMDRWCDVQNAETAAFFIDVMTTRRVDRLLGREAAIAAIEAGAAGVLLIRSLDRASRSVADGALLIERAKSNGWRVLGCDGTDSADDDQELANNARLLVAQEERRLISRRTKEGLERARANGRMGGRRSTVPGHVAQRIVELRGKGGSFRTIAATLDADGIATPGGSPSWRPAAVRDIYLRAVSA